VTESLLKVSNVSEGVLQIQINRPRVLNALNTQVLSLISSELEKAATQSSIKVVVLTGDKRAFAAGADIGELREFPKPIIAAVSGFALGGGCELMMVADIIVASRTAQFGQPEINLGIIPGAGGTQKLTRLIGKSASMKMNLTGEFIGAEEALRIGLISEMTEPELYLDRAIVLAKKIATKSTVAAQAIKSSVLNAYESTLSDGLSFERASFLNTVTGEDAAEGIAAFIEKRPANFPNN